MNMYSKPVHMEKEQGMDHQGLTAEDVARVLTRCATAEDVVGAMACMIADQALTMRVKTDVADAIEWATTKALDIVREHRPELWQQYLREAFGTDDLTKIAAMTGVLA